MDEPRTFECPSCGGELTTDGHSPTIQCSYCGQTVTVPQDLRVPTAPDEAPPPRIPVVERERPQVSRTSRGRGCGCGSLLFALILIFGVLLAGAVVSGNGPALFEVLNTVSRATPTAQPVHHALDAALPRSTRYAGVTLTLNKAELTNEDPKVSSGLRYRADRLYAILSVRLDNTAGERGVSLSPDVIRLELADGNQYQPDGSFYVDVASGATQQGQLVYQVPATTGWQGAKLVLRESGKEPAIVPLDGPAPAIRGPINLRLATEKAAGTILYRVLSATLDTGRDGQQVEAGKRFLRFDMRVVNNGKEPGGVAVSGSNFRLFVDGDSLAPDQSLIEAIPPQSKVDGQVDFTVPADAKSATLQVGELNGPRSQIPVNLAQ